MFFREGQSRLRFPSWQCTGRPPPAVWGALCGSHSKAGLWLATETAHRINELEWLAIQKAVRHFLPLIIDKVLMVHSDNSSAIVSLGIQGDTHLLPMGYPSGVQAAQYHPVSEAHSRAAECPGRRSGEKASSHWHRMVSTPQHSTPDVLPLVHSRVGPVRNSSQLQASSICFSSSRPSGSSSGYSVISLGQAVRVCLLP